MQTEAIKQQAYLNLRGVVPHPAEYWYSDRKRYTVAPWGEAEWVMTLTFEEACRIGLHDQALAHTEKLREEYEHLYSTL